ncbi:hypothetical protein ABPG77_008167 [Micractinium sp. CCAP 211/92]
MAFAAAPRLRLVKLTLSARRGSSKESAKCRQRWSRCSSRCNRCAAPPPACAQQHPRSRKGELMPADPWLSQGDRPTGSGASPEDEIIAPLQTNAEILQEIEAEQAAQNVTLNKLVAKMKSVNCDIKALHGDIDALRGAVKTLHGGTKPVKGDIGTVRDDTKRAKGDIKSLLGAIEDLQATLTTQGEALGTLVETSILVRRHLSKEDKQLRRSALTSTGKVEHTDGGMTRGP